MTNGSQKRTRLERVAALELPPGALERAVLYLRSRDVLIRMGLCVLAAIAMWLMMRGWAAPFSYRSGFEPPRDIISRVAFEIPDRSATEKEIERVRSQVVYTYDNDPEELKQRRAELVNIVAKIIAAPTLAELGPEVWDDFFTVAKDQPPPTPQESPPGLPGRDGTGASRPGSSPGTIHERRVALGRMATSRAPARARRSRHRPRPHREPVGCVV